MEGFEERSSNLCVSRTTWLCVENRLKSGSSGGSRDTHQATEVMRRRPGLREGRLVRGCWTLSSFSRAMKICRRAGYACGREGGAEGTHKVSDGKFRKMEMIFSDMGRFLREKDLRVKSSVWGVQFEIPARHPREDVKKAAGERTVKSRDKVRAGDTLFGN